MAAVMAECLEEIAKTNRVQRSAVPAGVYLDALEFVQLAVQATGASVPDNPPASLNAYVIASDVLRESSQEPSQTSDDINDQLKRYEVFLQSLNNPRELNEDDGKVVDPLKRFFVRLKEEGDSEAYAKATYLDPAPLGFPFR